jgi:uncharacterized membrane protein
MREKSPLEVSEVPKGWKRIPLNGSLEERMINLDKLTNKVVCISYNIDNKIENYVGVLDRLGRGNSRGELYQITDTYDKIDFELIEVDKISEIYTDSNINLPDKQLLKK